MILPSVVRRMATCQRFYPNALECAFHGNGAKTTALSWTAWVRGARRKC